MFSSIIFHSRLSSICKANATTITKFAREILRISTSAPTNWKNGTVPGADVVAHAASHFGVTADYLLGLSDAPKRMTDSELTQQEHALLAQLRAASPQARKAAGAAMEAVLLSFAAQDKSSV